MYNEKSDEYICSVHGISNEHLLGAVVPPIFQNSLHIFPTVEDIESFNSDKSYIYGRVSNPTVNSVEIKLAQLERGEKALCFSSGMAAISSAIMSLVSNGDHIIGERNIYGPGHQFISTYLKRFGIENTFVRGEDISEIESSIRPNTKVIYLESPSTLLFTVQDILKISNLAKQRGITVIIDNTWCTPIFQKPLELGADIVVHSLTKYIGGHSDIVGGAIVGKKEVMDKILLNERELFGGILGPFQAWLVLRGIRTLPVRMMQHQNNAMKAAEFLEKHRKVKSVNYPGLKTHPQYDLGKVQMKGYSGLMSVELDCDFEQTKKFVNQLKLFDIGVSWGGFESLVCMSSSLVSEEERIIRSIPKKLVRLSIGLEKIDDLLEDLDSSLRTI
jgi:cystathionine beta-lyase